MSVAMNVGEFLSFERSLGYNCLKNGNLIQINANTLAFSSGNFVHFFDVTSKRIESRRSVSNIGIACITKNPVLNHLTVAECGQPSTVYIYGVYPTLEIVAKCSDHSSSSEICCMAYNASGEFLAAQNAAPDSALTIWNWATMTIVLRAQCSAAAVTNTIQFSQFNANCLVAGGVGHMLFWDLSRTFTGPKLQCNRGRFGKFDECNVIAVCTMADDRTLSNCDGGNILVWESGAVAFEVCQKNRRPCHRRTIAQIYCHGDRVMTVGLDGFVRIWFWDTIAAARTATEEKYLEIDATYEYEIGNNGYRCAILSMVRYSAMDNRWFAQDANGGIWMSELHTGTDECRSEALYRCHAGAIVDVVARPVRGSDAIVSLGEDGRMHVYDPDAGKLDFFHEFCSAGRSMIWLHHTDHRVIVLGFADGAIRVMALNMTQRRMHMIEVTKPHHKSITKISANRTESILATAAEDESMFLYRIARPFKLEPIGLIRLLTVATDLAWFPNSDQTIFVGCIEAKAFKISIPDSVQASQTSYELNGMVQVTEIDMLGCNRTGGRIDVFAHWIKFIDGDILWISLSNGDLMEYNCSTESISHIHSFATSIVQACVTHDRKVIIFGHANGRVTVNQLGANGLIECQSLQMHDSQNGKITSLRFNCDRTRFYSAGVDGNLFVYSTTLTMDCEQPELATDDSTSDYPEIEDIRDTDRLSLEQEKSLAIAKANAERVNRKKSEILETINALRIEFELIIERNSRLPEAMRLSETDFEIDSRITDDIRAEIDRQMEKDRVEHLIEMNKIRSQWSKIDAVLLRNVECWAISLLGIRNNESVETFLIEKLSDNFMAARDEFENRANNLENESASTQPESSEHGNEGEATNTVAASTVPVTIEASSTMQDLVEFLDKAPLDVQTKRLLKKYKERKQQAVGRQQKWRSILAKKPCPGVIDPAEHELFEQAKSAIGNFVLKSDPENVAVERSPEKLTIAKYLELKRLRDEIHQMKRDFNEQVVAARQQKLDVCDYVNEELKKLRAIHLEIPPDQIVTIDVVPSIDENVELLDRNFGMAATIVKGETPMLNKVESECEDDLKRDFYQAALQINPPAASTKPNNIETKLRRLRLSWKLFEQNAIMDRIEERIRLFDEHLHVLKDRRLETALQVNFMELYYFTVYQELMVLKNFEKSQVLLMQDIETGRVEAPRIEAKIVKENAILRELQRRESDSAETANGNDRHSCETAPVPEIAFDEDGSSGITSAPNYKSLEHSPNNSREKCGSSDFKSQEHAKLVDAANENIRQLTGNLDAVNKDLQANEFALRMLLQEKHKQLNNVDTLIVMRRDQLQHEDNSEADDYIVVNNDTITKLYQRINRLAVETAEEQASERFYVNQLAKMKSECTAAAKTISTATSSVRNAMIRKFGQEIDLDEMEETILSRLFSTGNGDREHSERQSKSLRELRKRLVEKKKELLQLKQANVEKLNLLTELQEEKNIVEYQLRFQERLRAKRTSDTGQARSDKDLQRLRTICRQQRQQLKSIDKQIQALRMRAKPLEPLNFVDGMRRAQNVEADNIANVVDITAPESLHSTEGPSSASSSSLHVNAVGNVRECVARFLRKHLAIPIDEAALNACATEISEYFVRQFAKRAQQMQQSDQMLRKTIENLSNFVPDAALGHIGATEYVQLYADIRRYLPNANGDDAMRFSVMELLRSILDEMVNAIPPSIDDYSNFLLSEFLRESFAVLSLDDANKVDQMKAFMGSFRRLQRFSVAEIDADRCATQLWAHRDTFMAHELNERGFHRLITHLIEEIKN